MNLNRKDDTVSSMFRDAERHGDRVASMVSLTCHWNPTSRSENDTVFRKFEIWNWCLLMLYLQADTAHDSDIKKYNIIFIKSSSSGGGGGGGGGNWTTGFGQTGYLETLTWTGRRAITALVQSHVNTPRKRMIPKKTMDYRVMPATSNPARYEKLSVLVPNCACLTTIRSRWARKANRKEEED
ncbi:hypothetical protein CPLU01_02874 [Colletotrichum plurivorum]|uniref:Uncharacterized protein n=1 Tax=Colletotrichum plurivorum TaxID=2175906 RepID=A0A8H6KUY2_9PEZI|nr:hypothetical protein CPLU01_02874 [Colletotrichum plurivorum]